MDKLAKYHEVWRPLVTYASTGEEFRRLFFTCMNYSGTVGADSLEEDGVGVQFAGAGRKMATLVIHKSGDSVSFCLDLQKGLTLEDGAKKYQEDFKRLLAWLTNRNSEDREAALSFLWKQGRDIKIEATVDDDVYSQSIHEYGTVASPTCKFILDRIDRYNEGRQFIVVDQNQNATPDHSYNEKLRKEILPLGLCKYCRNFMVVERSSKQFCSDLCRAQSGQAKKTKAQRAQDMRKYRNNPTFKARVARRKRHLHN